MSKNYNWDATAWAPDGTLAGGIIEANFNDVIYGTASDKTLNGFGGNDAVDAGLGDDVIDKNPHLIAGYAYHTRTTALFYCQNKHHKAQKQQFQHFTRRSSAKTACACFARLAGHKRLERRMDSASAGICAAWERICT